MGEEVRLGLGLLFMAILLLGGIVSKLERILQRLESLQESAKTVAEAAERLEEGIRRIEINAIIGNTKTS